MTVRLSRRSFQFAKSLINEGRVVLDGMDDWSEHQPSTQQEDDFIAKHGFSEYKKWHLGVDDEEDEDTKARYKFPHGDFDKVHRCAVMAAETQAEQKRYTDIELAAAHLHGMLDALE